MFDIGFQEMLVIGVIALLVFGPSKLPELGRMVGKALREFRRASDEFRQTVETNLHINEQDPIMTPSTTVDVETPPTSVPFEAEAAVAGEPVASGDDTAGPEALPAEPYCARRESRLFHRSECQWVTRIPEAQRTYFKTLAEAREQGFVTCPVCEPWEPS